MSKKKPDYVMYLLLIAILYMLYINAVGLQAILGSLGSGSPMPPLQIVLPPWLENVTIPLPPGMNYSIPPHENVTLIYTSSADCKTACANYLAPWGTTYHYDNGSCLWASEAQTYMPNPIGQCYVPGNRHCGNVGECSCYCWYNSQANGLPPPGSGENYCDQYTCGKGGQMGTCPADYPTCEIVGFNGYDAYVCINEGTQMVAPNWKPSIGICHFPIGQ